MIFSDISVNSQPFFFNFAKAIFYSNPNSPENFVILYSIFQKLDHLTIMTSLYNPIKLTIDSHRRAR